MSCELLWSVWLTTEFFSLWLICSLNFELKITTCWAYMITINSSQYGKNVMASASALYNALLDLERAWWDMNSMASFKRLCRCWTCDGQLILHLSVILFLVENMVLENSLCNWRLSLAQAVIWLDDGSSKDNFTFW